MIREWLIYVWVQCSGGGKHYRSVQVPDDSTHGGRSVDARLRPLRARLQRGKNVGHLATQMEII